jgi:hypothetical protein
MRNEAAGRLMKKTAGNAARKNLNAQSWMGEISLRPTLMTTKLNPQIATTNIANAI